MIRSMTGYGRASCECEYGTINVEIKSVNHRFLDLGIKCHRLYNYIEEPVKKQIKQTINRGKIDVYVNIEKSSDNNVVKLNESLALGYITALNDFCQKYDIKNDLSLSVLARYQDIFEVEKTEEDEEALLKYVLECTDNAVKELILIRETEGEKLKEDVLLSCKAILEKTENIEKLASQSVDTYRQKLCERVTEVIQNYNIDPKIDDNRVITEVCLFADKVAVNEEVVRIKSHIAQIYSILDSDEPKGKKLDFIVQELNREINTIGAKSNDLVISQTVIDTKNEIEKIREQIQNIE